jgi:4-hydroxy-tetrahydrodipicolinate synthase
MLQQLPNGLFPVMLTPFREDASASVDLEALAGLARWYMASGAVGLFTVCRSSEMYLLSPAVRRWQRGSRSQTGPDRCGQL